MGLFWNIVPFCARVNPDDKLSQLLEIQRLLIDIEPYVRYPLTQILENQQKSELFFATLNFLYFHNSRQTSDGSGPRILRSNGHGKFHFPLNYVVSVSPFSGQSRLMVCYDKRYFSRIYLFDG